MTRGVGLILALISLAVVGGLMAMQSKSSGPTSAAATQVETLALATAAAANFGPVDQILALDHAQSGTYAGAELPAGTGVAVVQATSTSYCLQSTLDGTTLHELGPGGPPSPGPC